ncbi:MAG: hypothetical protein M0Z31_11210 [Clostridia bacterium]|nr:hypothetical protein [Clostridia bacterium]
MANQGGFNALCEKCRCNCKQEAAAKILGCPLFVAKPKQMEFSFNKKDKRKKPK